MNSSINSDQFLNDKGQTIKEQLSDFFNSGGDKEHVINSNIYSNFYREVHPSSIMQGDLLYDIPICFWEDEKFNSVLGFVIVISNSCDISSENSRKIPKEALIAPVIPVANYKDTLLKGLSEEYVNNLFNDIVNQRVSNILYLPPTPNGKDDFIVLLDKINWIPTQIFHEKVNSNDDFRPLSLSQIAYYLFIVKIAYHFCRISGD